MLITTESSKTYKVSLRKIKLAFPVLELKNTSQVEFYKQFSNDHQLIWNSMKIAIPRYTEKHDDITENKMIFDNLNLKQSYIVMSDKQYPNFTYRCNFSAPANYGKYYTKFLKPENKFSSLVSYEKYKNLYPILTFNLENKDYKNISNINITFH